MTTDDANEDPVLAELEALADQDKLDAESVVAAAANPSSPLHSRFEWDDAIAGHAYRLGQGRNEIARYRLTIVVDEQPIEVRRFVKVEAEHRAVPVERALRDWRPDLEAQAARGHQAWRSKYRHLGDETLKRIISDVE